MFPSAITPRSVSALQRELRQLIVQELAPVIFRLHLLTNHGSGVAAGTFQTQARALAQQSGPALRGALLALGRAE
jgi:hypothetical protein